MSTDEKRNEIAKLRVQYQRAERRRIAHMRNLQAASTMEEYRAEVDKWTYWYKYCMNVQIAIDELEAEL